MDRIPQRDKPQEGRTSKSTAKAGQRPWETEQYIYQEEPENAKRSLHDDPRLESHGQHQHPDSDFIPSDEDGDHGYGYPAFGIGTTPDLSASDPSTSDQGTLAGESFFRGFVYNSPEPHEYGRHRTQSDTQVNYRPWAPPKKRPVFTSAGPHDFKRHRTQSDTQVNYRS